MGLGAVGDGPVFQFPTTQSNSEKLRNITPENFESLEAYLFDMSDPRLHSRILQYAIQASENKDALIALGEAVIDQNNQQQMINLINQLATAGKDVYNSQNSPLYDVRNATNQLNTAVAIYNAQLPNASPQARADFQAAIDSYNNNPSVLMAIATQNNYQSIAQAYNANVTLIINNLDTYNLMRSSIGLSPPVTLAQLPLAPKFNPDPVIISLYPSPSPINTQEVNSVQQPSDQPIVQVNPTIPFPFTPVQIPDIIDQIVGEPSPVIPTSQAQEISTSLVGVDSSLLYYFGDITLPVAFIKRQFSPDFDDTTAGTSSGASIEFTAITLGLSHLFFQAIISGLVYDKTLAELSLPTSPELKEQLQTFTLQLISGISERAARNQNIANLIRSSGVPQPSDPMFKIATTLAFADILRDGNTLAAIKTGVMSLINNNPKFAQLPASKRIEAATVLSKVVYASLLEVAFSRHGFALNSPGLTPQVLANTPAFASIVSDAALNTQAPNFENVLTNPLSLIFLKINLLTVLRSRLPSESDAQTLSKLGKKINNAINEVAAKLDTIESEEELKTALMEAFAKQGIADPGSLAETTTVLIKTEPAFPTLDKPFNPETLSLIVPFLQPSFATLAASTLASQLASEPGPSFSAQLFSTLPQMAASPTSAIPISSTAADGRPVVSGNLIPALAKRLTQAAPKLFVAEDAVTAERVVQAALSAGFSTGTYYTLKTFRQGLITAFTNPQQQIPSAQQIPPVSERIANILAQEAVNLITAVPIEKTVQIQPPQPVIMDALTDLLTKSGLYNEVTAKTLVKEVFNTALVTPGFLNSEEEAQTAFLNTYLALGVSATLANTLASTTVSMIASSITGTALPFALALAFPLEAQQRRVAQLMSDAEDATVATAITNAVYRAADLGSLRNTYSDIFQELIMAGDSPIQAARRADNATLVGTAQIDAFLYPLQVAGLNTKLSQTELADGINNTVVGILANNMGIIKAGDVAGQIIRSLMFLGISLNEVFRDLHDEGLKDALHALKEDLFERSITPSLSQVALQANISKTMVDKVSAYMNPALKPTRVDVRQQDKSTDPLFFGDLPPV